jgi:putative spermidine/putrescine transport system permease protein
VSGVATARAPSARWLAAPSLALLLAAFLAPLLLFLLQSAHRFVAGQVSPDWSLATLAAFVTDPFQLETLLNSLALGAIVTLLTLVFAYPVALFMAERRGSLVFAALALIVFSPVLVSIVVRAYGWQLLLANNGVANAVLRDLGLIDRPARLMFNWFGVIVSMVHVELPFMLFPILTVLLQIPNALKEAAQDLGASEFETWRRAVLPLSLPGILSGCQIVFTTAISAFASPTILGGGRVRVMPVSIYQNILSLNWPLGAVQSIMLLLFSLASVTLFSRILGRSSRWEAG